MTWASLPQNPTTDAALRRAAAEKVMGWHLLESGMLQSADYSEVWAGSDGIIELTRASWLGGWDRNDLARVFAAALAIPLTGFADAQPIQVLAVWKHALSKPRYALCRLLEILAIPVPPELEKEQ